MILRRGLSESKFRETGLKQRASTESFGGETCALTEHCDSFHFSSFKMKTFNYQTYPNFRFFSDFLVLILRPLHFGKQGFQEKKARIGNEGEQRKKWKKEEK